MQDMISAQSRKHISTAVMGSVLECHDQGFHFLGGMVPNAAFAGFQAHMQADWSGLHWRVDPGYGGDVFVGPPVLSSSDPLRSAFAPEAGPEHSEGGAVRHLRKLMAMGRDGKMRYLSDAGMGKETAEVLVSLVLGWLDEAGLERLGELSKVAVQRDLGPGHVLERWINGRSQLRLALLLDTESFGDSHLAAAYAVSHAADLVLASYRSGLGADDSDLSFVPGDDLD